MTSTILPRPDRTSSLFPTPQVAKLWLDLDRQPLHRGYRATGDSARSGSSTGTLCSTSTLVGDATSGRKQSASKPTSSHFHPPPKAAPIPLFRKIRPLPVLPETDCKSPRALPPLPQTAPLGASPLLRVPGAPGASRPGHRPTASTSSVPSQCHPASLLPGRPGLIRQTQSDYTTKLRPSTGNFGHHHDHPAPSSPVVPIFAAKEIADELERRSIKSLDENDEEEDVVLSSDDECDPDESFSVQVVRGIAYRTTDVRRVSKLWQREWVSSRGGTQWEPMDYASVMNALRAL